MTDQQIIALSSMVAGSISSVATAIAMKRGERIRISKLERWKADVENHFSSPSKIRDIEDELREIRERASEIEQVKLDANQDRSEVWRALRSIRNSLQSVSENLQALEARYSRGT